MLKVLKIAGEAESEEKAKVYKIIEFLGYKGPYPVGVCVDGTRFLVHETPTFSEAVWLGKPGEL